MNAPVLWIAFPGVIAAALFLARHWHRIVVLVGTATCLLLVLLAWQMPIDQMIRLGPWTLKLLPNLEFLGRRFLLLDADRPLLILIYLVAAFWIAASYISGAGRMFVPMSLAMVSLLIAALAVEPFLFAALLIEMAVLVSVLILAAPGKPVAAGVTRFLVLQTFGMPFILFTGWMLTGVEATPGDLELVIRAAILLGFGFAFLLAIFPFHTWIPMVMENSNPYAAAFVMFMLPWMVVLFGLSFLDRYAWLRNSSNVSLILQYAGLLMVLVGGSAALFQRHLGRILGYAVMTQIGVSLLVVSIPGRLDLYFAMLVPQTIALGVWALGLTAVHAEYQNLRFRAVQGFARKMPVVAAGLILAHFSIAGFPVLAGFPTLLTLWTDLAARSAWAAGLALLGAAGLLGSAFRCLAVAVMGDDQQAWKISESGILIFFLAIGTASLFVMGLFPPWFSALIAQVPKVFPQLLQ